MVLGSAQHSVGARRIVKGHLGIRVARLPYGIHLDRIAELASKHGIRYAFRLSLHGRVCFSLTAHRGGNGAICWTICDTLKCLSNS